MIHRPSNISAFEFAVLSGLRAGQLMRGCIPRVEVGTHKKTSIAQLEVAAGKVTRGVDLLLARID
jgi:DNA-directed RNA polymerase subunit K/omega